MSTVTLGAFLTPTDSTPARDPKNPWSSFTTTSWADEMEKVSVDVPQSVSAPSGAAITVRQDLPTLPEVGQLVVTRRHEMRKAAAMLDEIVNNTVGAQNRRQEKQAIARQKESLRKIKAEYQYWNAVVTELKTADDYLAIYYEKVRRRGYSPEIRKILADLKRA